MDSKPLASPITLAKSLRAVSLPLAVVLIGVGLGFMEHQRAAQHGHLSPYAPGSVPQLQGKFLSDYAHQTYELAPGAAQPNILMGVSLAEQGRIKLARVHLERALSINRRDPQLLFLYAQVLQALDEDPETIQELKDELRRYFPQDWGLIQSEFKNVKPRGRPSSETKPS